MEEDKVDDDKEAGKARQTNESKKGSIEYDMEEKKTSGGDVGDQVSTASDDIGFHFPCLDLVTYSQMVHNLFYHTQRV